MDAIMRCSRSSMNMLALRNTCHLHPARSACQTVTWRQHCRFPSHCVAADSSQVGATAVGEDDVAGVPEGDGSRKELMHEAMQRLSNTQLEEAATKYGLDEELFGEIDFARVNAFSRDAFGGNPAAVCYLPYYPSDDWLQQVAAEFNLSETAFVVRRRGRKAATGEGSGGEGAAAEAERRRSSSEFDLRWFTPTIEVNLCGHATLASALFLFATGLVGGNRITFHSKAGPLTAQLIRTEDSLLRTVGGTVGAGAEGCTDCSHTHSPDGTVAATDSEAGAAAAAVEQSRGAHNHDHKHEHQNERKPASGQSPGKRIVEISLPSGRLTPLPLEEWAAVEEALGVKAGTAVHVAKCEGTLDWLVHLPSASDVLNLSPIPSLVASLPCRGVITTAAVSPTIAAATSSSSPASPVGIASTGDVIPAGVDFVTRFFAPQCGIDEDPVTGSAFCALLPYWAPQLGRDSLVGLQASTRQGLVAAQLDEATGRVRLQGWAVVTMAGMLMNTTGPKRSTAPQPGTDE